MGFTAAGANTEVEVAQQPAGGNEPLYDRDPRYPAIIGNGSGGGGAPGGGGDGRESGPNGDVFFCTHGNTSDPNVPGGTFVSFGSKEIADGYHKTTVVRQADETLYKVSKVRGGAFTGRFWEHVAWKVTGSS